MNFKDIDHNRTEKEQINSTRSIGQSERPDINILLNRVRNKNKIEKRNFFYLVGAILTTIFCTTIFFQ
jgi:hypothetical protein